MTQHWRKQASVAYGYSLTRLALNYYIYFSDADEEINKEKLKEADQQFHQILGACLAGEAPLDALKKLREKVTREMKAVTAYVDCFRNYEYALNRLERRFETDLPGIDVSEEEFVRQLMHFIGDVKDAAEMNRRIQMTVSQLPVRFTRQKFYAVVMEALSSYIGADKSSLENIMYLLRTSAMVELSEEQKSGYHDLDELLSQLRSLPFKDLKAAQYREAMNKIGYASEALYLCSDTWQMLQDMINDLYVIFLTRDDAVIDTAEERNALSILNALYRQYQAGDCGKIADAVTEQLSLLEGVQEHYLEKYLRLDAAPAYREGEDVTAYYGRCVDKLLSSSPFASMEDATEEQRVGKTDVEEAANTFFSLTDPVLAENPKPVARAIMATVLSSLPVCFNSIDEVREYIANSFASCTDLAEKETCMELLQDLMRDEDYGVV